LKIKELMKHMQNKEFASVRQWVVSNIDNDPQHIFRKIYDGLYEHLKSGSIPTAILTLAEYQYKSAFVADQEINLVACLVELMMGCEFK
ncbi:DNA polymerase, partial [bacterium]|nr:DNA polymerase [bacterium]